MNTIPLFFSRYDVFSGKFQSAHFVLFKNLRLRRLFKFISLSLRDIVRLDILIPRLELSLLQKVVAVANRSFFDSLPIHLSFLSVFFLGLQGVFFFLASQDPVSSSFLKMLWITLLDFPTVFEISAIESLSSFCNLTISFLSSNDVTDFFPTVFEISAIESLSSLRNVTISFLSSNDVTDFFPLFTMQETVKGLCNLVKYPIFYS